MTSRLSPGGLQQALGIEPDLTTLGKYLGGGLSFGAFGGRQDVMEQFDPRRSDALPHAGTFNNNVLSMAAGLAGLTRVFTPAAADTLNARGDALRSHLNVACQERGAQFQFTGIGSMICAHPVDRPIGTAADAPVAGHSLRDLFFFDMLERGIYLARRGFMALSLPIGAAEMARLEAAVGDFLDTRLDLVRES